MCGVNPHREIDKIEEEILEMEKEKMPLTFKQELEDLLNRYSKENGSDTPDFILASYLERCLYNFDRTLRIREKHISSDKNENVASGIVPGATVRGRL